MNNKVMVAMSGGVDSSVSLILLKEQGYELCGATLRLYDGNDKQTTGNSNRDEQTGNEQSQAQVKKETCGSVSDAEIARQIAGKMGVPHYILDYREMFAQEVIERFAKGYELGDTPNPCIYCNRFIKFPNILREANALGCDFIATGHYANIRFDRGSGRYLLSKAVDKSKDQTYVLYSLSQDVLSKTILPLGGMRKVDIRAFAEERGLVNANKPDSQDICFVKEGDYASFLENVWGLDPQLGRFTGTDGTDYGFHKGLIHYTIGQRKGLGVSGGRPLFVVSKDVENKTVFLGDNHELFSKGLMASDVNWIAIEGLTSSMKVTAKTRYKQQESSATIHPVSEGMVMVEFDEPQRAITPGQGVVFYNDEYVVGGGIISKAIL